MLGIPQINFSLLRILEEEEEGRLRDVDRIHEPSHPRRIDPLADESPDLILVRLDQFPRRLLIPFPQSPHQVIEGSIRGHKCWPILNPLKRDECPIGSDRKKRNS
jgi:hypothetical protein